MCDERSLNDMNEYLQRAEGGLSRRRLGALSFGAGLMAALPRAAHALDVKETDVLVKTADGTAEAYFVHPSTGKHPAVLFWPDAYGLRSTLKQMGKRLAESGYSVLIPNPFYRTAKVPVLPDGLDIAKPDDRVQIVKMIQTLSPDTHVTDAKAFVTYLDGQSQVDTARKMGTIGYCMGGPITMRTAAERPDRVGAAASFHGGGLVTNQPNSPHLLVPKMKVQYLIAIAENDDKAQPEAKTVLHDAFVKAGLKAEIEVYAGALHGWCPPDAAVYNEAQAERAWGRLIALFKGALA